MHHDRYYNSFSTGMRPTQEGLECVDSLIKLICGLKPMEGLEWNHKLASLIDVNDVKRIDMILSSIDSVQHGE
jgi:hypothetical protein